MRHSGLVSLSEDHAVVLKEPRFEGRTGLLLKCMSESQFLAVYSVAHQFNRGKIDIWFAESPWNYRG